MQLIIKLSFQNWSTMAFVGMPLTVADDICLIRSNIFLAYLQFLVVYLITLYWAHYSFLNIYYEPKDLSNLNAIVNRELRLVKKWLDANKLSLSIDTTNYIIFHSFSVNISSTFDIKIWKNRIKRVTSVNFLGVPLDEHLNWKWYLSELSKKLAKECRMYF